jgi:hypothetical protein
MRKFMEGSTPAASTILRSEPTPGGFERRMVSSVALAKEDCPGIEVPSYGWQAIHYMGSHLCFTHTF